MDLFLSPGTLQGCTVSPLYNLLLIALPIVSRLRGADLRANDQRKPRYRPPRPLVRAEVDHRCHEGTFSLLTRSELSPSILIVLQYKDVAAALWRVRHLIAAENALLAPTVLWKVLWTGSQF